ncbi:hypothetical protein [Pseudonocardia sp.]|uniref:hypothetical protein n=1 Tax=Pseudonocardia sp. TaxID=60912 RepID=UPI0025DAB35D|nr:hypothetical protein [Pseudonocardia sp.]
MSEDDTARSDNLAIVGLLTFDGLLLGAFGLAFTPLFIGPVPVPIGALLSILILPWLVLRAGEIDPRPGPAATPLIAWFLAVVVLGFAGPGGDVLLPTQPGTFWTSFVLVFGGLGAGLYALRRVLTTGATHV